MGTEDRLLTSGEVASLFRVDPKTVSRWATSARIASIRTPGGHRRFRESEVRAILEHDPEPVAALRPGTSEPTDTHRASNEQGEEPLVR